MARKTIKRVTPKNFDGTLTFNNRTRPNELQLTQEQAQKLNEILAWEKQSAKANWILGQPRNRVIRPVLSKAE